MHAIPMHGSIPDFQYTFYVRCLHQKYVSTLAKNRLCEVWKLCDDLLQRCRGRSPRAPDRQHDDA